MLLLGIGWDLVAKWPLNDRHKAGLVRIGHDPFRLDHLLPQIVEFFVLMLKRVLFLVLYLAIDDLLFILIKV